MRRSVLALLALATLILVPSAAFAQGSLTGVVRDSSGAVLPGVTVEASVTFALPGFSTVRRDGIELEGCASAGRGRTSAWTSTTCSTRARC